MSGESKPEGNGLQPAAAPQAPTPAPAVAPPMQVFTKSLPAGDLRKG